MVKTMFGKFWGNHMNGKLVEIMNLISDDNPETIIKVLPLLEKNKYGNPQLLLSNKPSLDCLDKIKEDYRVRIFQTDDIEDNYKYLMTLETLRFSYEEEWHFADHSLSRHITGNKWDFDGYFYITDSMCDYTRVAIIPYSTHAHEFDGGFNMSKPEALRLVKGIVRLLNNGGLL